MLNLINTVTLFLKRFYLMVLLVFLACNDGLKHSDAQIGKPEITGDSIVKHNDSIKFKYKDFEVFYDRFRNDSSFQLQHTKFPLKGKYSDPDQEIPWTEDEWPLIHWDLRNEVVETLDSFSIIQESKRFFYGQYCTDCGFSFEMEFRKINGSWFLVYRQENND